MAVARAIGAALALVAMAPAAAAQAPGFVVDDVPTQGGLVRGLAPDGAMAVAIERPGASPQPAARAGRRFLVALDRDAGPEATLVATLADGRRIVQPLAVAPRAWRLEHVNAPYRAGRTTAEFMRLRGGELAQIADARRPDPAREALTGWQAPLAWPITGRIAGLFGAQRIYQGQPGSYHGGIDIAAPTGAVVRAPADGVVTLAADRPFTLEGNLLLLDHGGGLESAFLHLSRIDVAVGQHVRAGDPIGRVGATGRATGPHLHWGLRWRDARLDPLLAAGGM